MIVCVSGPRFRGFEMSNLVDRVVENVFQTGLKFISLGSVKNITCVGHKD